ncbi:hypothetical protein OSB04_008481 [Centaurea solstitialis]|uniref:Pectinesterase n=1 Tax=Centaurea solstitialis TaxID=347529 RepID=A0AA38TXE1_9ASTR|nr:hypothetical protein OSB04_008481 [Centaurea solstitialis]
MLPSTYPIKPDNLGSMDSGNAIFSFTSYASILLIIISAPIVLQPHSATATAHSNSVLIDSSCSITRHPHLCYSMFSDNTRNLATPQDVIRVALDKTKEIVKRNYVNVNKIRVTHNNLTNREKIAIRDCLELATATLEGLEKVVGYVDAYPGKKFGTRRRHRHVDDMVTVMSTTLTNQETCIDGLSHDENEFRNSVIEGAVHVGKLCSNSLAMIKNYMITDTDNEMKIKMKGMTEDEGWPEWLSAGDRQLLRSGTVTPNVVVAANGNGDFTTISAAVAAAPSRSATRYVIGIAPGVYTENVEVPSNKNNLMFIGSGIASTIITGNRSVAGGSTTFNSATLVAVGAGFLARDITIENTAGPSGDQAVALRVGSDLSAFYRCGINAYQDTLYVHSNRQLFISCYISGTVDFIFGNSAVLLQDCDIEARLPGPKQKNMVTAQGRTDPNQNTGIVIQNSRIGATCDLLPVQQSFPTYLGRPWKLYSRTVVMQSTISDVIRPEGWFPWDKDFALDTLYYAEFQNTGAGADTSNRVTWGGYKVLTNATEAQGFTAINFINGGNWLADTGFPFSLDLGFISHMVKVMSSTPVGVHCGGFSLSRCRVRILADALKLFKWKLDG